MRKRIRSERTTRKPLQRGKKSRRTLQCNQARSVALISFTSRLRVRELRHTLREIPDEIFAIFHDSCSFRAVACRRGLHAGRKSEKYSSDRICHRSCRRDCTGNQGAIGRALPRSRGEDRSADGGGYGALDGGRKRRGLCGGFV